MNGVNYSFIHVYDDGDFCPKKTDKEIYQNPGIVPGANLNPGSGGSGGSGSNPSGGSGLTEEEKAALTAAVGKVDTLSTSLENHIGDYNNPHRVKIGQIEGLSSKLNELTTAVGAATEITDEQLEVFRQLMETYETNTSVVQNTVVETLDGTKGQGTTIEKTEDNKVSVNINLADNLTLVEKTETAEGGATTTTTAISQCWTGYDDDNEESSESGAGEENQWSEI